MANYKINIKCINKILYDRILDEIRGVLINFYSNFKDQLELENIITKENKKNLEINIYIKDLDIIPIIKCDREDNIHTSNKFNEDNNFIITIKSDYDNIIELGQNIHNNLAGIQDYIDSKILLNINDTEIMLVLGAESDYYPIISFYKIIEFKKVFDMTGINIIFGSGITNLKKYLIKSSYDIIDYNDYNLNSNEFSNIIHNNIRNKIVTFIISNDISDIEIYNIYCSSCVININYNINMNMYICEFFKHKNFKNHTKFILKLNSLSNLK